MRAQGCECLCAQWAVWVCTGVGQAMHRGPRKTRRPGPGLPTPSAVLFLEEPTQTEMSKALRGREITQQEHLIYSLLPVKLV